MAYEDKVPVVIVSKVLEKYDLTFKDLKEQPATFRPSSEIAHLFNSSTDKKVDEVSHSYDDRDEEMDDYLNSTDKEVDEPKTSNATSTDDIMMHMLDAGITDRSEAAKFFSLNYSDMPLQQIEFFINHYFQEFQEEDKIDYDDENFSDPFIDGDLDEIATDVTGFPKWRELGQDEKDHISKFVKDSGDRDQVEYEKRRDERLKAQSDRLDKYIQGQRGLQEDFETVLLKDIL